MLSTITVSIEGLDNLKSAIENAKNKFSELSEAVNKADNKLSEFKEAVRELEGNELEIQLK